MHRLFFIVNPVAGSGRSAKAFAEVKSRLDEMGADYGFAYTQAPGQGVELARAALEAGERCVIACGGDGTVNEVASVLVGSGVTMGILPFGTGNDLSRTLQLPTEPEAALQVLLAGRTRPLDTARANGKFFINAAGYGFDVDVLHRLEKYKTRFNGMLPYLMAVAETLFHVRRRELTITTAERGTVTMKAFIIVAGNGQYLGGGMHGTPEADPFDGLLDVCVVKDMPIYQFIPAIVRFVLGKHLVLPQVEYYKAAEISVACPDGGVIQLDGELHDGVPVTFRVLPASLPILVQP